MLKLTAKPTISLVENVINANSDTLKIMKEYAVSKAIREVVEAMRLTFKDIAFNFLLTVDLSIASVSALNAKVINIRSLMDNVSFLKPVEIISILAMDSVLI